MDEKLQILQNSKKNINSVDVDSQAKITLYSNESIITEYDVKSVINVTELFEIEREETEIYRIYGRIEYLSILNNINENYSELKDFFLPKIQNNKNLLNSFDFYLLKPASTGFTETINGNYIRKFEVIATPNEFEIYYAGFSKNLYKEQIFAFNFTEDIDISTIFDELYFPATELFLFTQYKPSINGNFMIEKMSATTWTYNESQIVAEYTGTTYNIGDLIYGDIIFYDKENFLQEQITGQTYYISTEYLDASANSKTLIWNYNPFKSIRLRYFEEDLNKINTGDTVYEQTTTIPEYATNLGDGNMVWRYILPQGFIDPLTDLGVSTPFVNKRRYLFSTLVIDIVPYLDDDNTHNVFNEILFNENTELLNTKPISNINNIGKPCL